MQGSDSMRARRLYAFSPNTSPALEDRIVLSNAGLMAPLAAEVVPISAAATQAEDFRFPTELSGRSPLMDELSGLMNLAFSNFAEDYRALRTSYFEAIGALSGTTENDNNDDENGEPNGAPAMPGQSPESLAESFHQAIRARAGQLREQVNSALDDVQGGGGMLNSFGRARVDQLAQELVNIDPIGVGQLNPAEYSLMGEYAIADGLFATRQFIQVYDAALFQTASGIFSGNIRFFRGGAMPTEALQQLSPAVEPVLEGLNEAYSGFVNGLRDFRSEYRDSIDDGENDDRFETFRTSVSERAEMLRGEAIDAINRPAGGAGVLSGFATDQLNQVQVLLASLPALGTTPLGAEAHAMLTEQVVGRSLNDMHALVQLYDMSLFTTALNFFNANPRFATQGAGSPGGSGGQVGTRAAQDGSEAVQGVPGVGVAAQTIGGGLGTIPGIGFGSPIGPSVPSGFGGTPFSPGAPPTSFFGPTPIGFNPSFGFGGLGGGFNFGRPTNFGTGFGFGGQPFRGLGPGGTQFGQSLGFGTGGAFGFGNQFGAVAGPGLGTGIGFGGFFL